MFDKVNLEEELKSYRSLSERESEVVLDKFKSLFTSHWEDDQEISTRLNKGVISADLITPEFLDSNRIFTLPEIEKLCLKYRLRFLSTKYFKKDYPAEALAKVRAIEKHSGQRIDAFMIVAPAEMFNLEDSNKDPLLFTPLSDGRFFLIHKWGSDLSVFRKITAWPTKKISHLFITLFAISLCLAFLIPTQWFNASLGYFNLYRFGFIGFNLILLSSVVSYFWFTFNIKFGVTAWRSHHFN